MAIDYNVFYTREKGKAYKDEQIETYSNYRKPIDHSPGRLAGNSRIWGDIAIERQRKIIDAVVVAARGAGFNTRRLALLLAMVKIESGFNLDAAAGTTSASSLGQFIKRTGAAFGLNDDNRFDLAANVSALVEYYIYNEDIVKDRGKSDIWVYKYHHDGPTSDYGGEKLAVNKFAPLANRYQEALSVGHALSIVDPSGAPIKDAHIKLTQNGKTAMLKTDENGFLPKFCANPELGKLNVYIQKASEEFKQIGEIALSKFESAWTIVAPKQRSTVKTHVHEAHAGAAPGDGQSHKVKKGETLSGIARGAGCTYLQIAKLNNIAAPYLLHPGQILKMPDAKKKPPAAKPAAAPAKPASAPAQPPAPASRTAAPAATKPAASAPEPKKEPAKPALAASAPVVTEKRSAQTSHPEAQVTKVALSHKNEAAIAYALKHKKASSIGYCLRHVKNALWKSGFYKDYPGCQYAKDFGPFLKKAGFANLLETRPGTDLNSAPLGAIVIYWPVESQTYTNAKSKKTEVIAGHIEIKCTEGYVSDFLAKRPTYSMNPKTLVSPKSSKYGVTFKVTGIWYKDE
ncbi:LysM peptidoglycan-binding domain-containing protein [Janthinobacterium agaricidamnosum]|uniref:LysM domain protein n=1 Tax=Janthinobacterium agaricidamnosum NBRC 102515 = DSM 9628 TaxID=1349767 RepID=W0V310_9BURK|nr:LysM peptidoglycan-binding domain-containing protein [Janthinobacterium agaricidamnosum]CDG83224.1 lysM domain protein [Janthinobacterium agaricidamnosum NBRC 102515 = DSM 9628]